jgi:hypothetical protein
MGLVKRAGKTPRAKTMREQMRDSKKKAHKGGSLNKKYGKRKK